MIEIGYIVTIFSAVLFFCTAFADIFVLPKTFAMLAGLACIWSWAATNRRVCRPAPTWLDVPMLAFGLAMAVTTATSQDLYLSLIGQHLGQFNSCLAFGVVAAAFFGARYGRGDIDATVVARLALVAAVPLSMYGIVQAFGKDPVLQRFAVFFGGRIFVGHGSPVYLGALLAMLLPAAVHFATQDENGDDMVIGTVSTFFICVALALTKTRGAMMAAAGGVAVLLALRHGMASRSAKLAWAGAFALPFVLGRAALLSDLGRLEVWRVAVRVFADHRWLGTGPDTFGLAFRQHIAPQFITAMTNATIISPTAHNDFLQVAATMGVLGLLAYAWVLLGAVLMVRDGLRCGFKDGYNNALIVGSCGAALLIAAKVNPVSLAPLVLLALMLGGMPVNTVYAMPAWTWRLREAIGGHVRVAGFASVIAMLGVTGVMLAAERAQRRAVAWGDKMQPVRAAVEYNRAAQINRWDIFYTQKQVEFLAGMIGLAKPEQRPMMAQVGVNIARRQVRLHPADGDAYALLAHALVVQTLVAQVDNTGEALDALKTARTLAPTFPGVLYAMKNVATYRGDLKTLREVDAQIALVSRAAEARP